MTKHLDAEKLTRREIFVLDSMSINGGRRSSWPGYRAAFKRLAARGLIERYDDPILSFAHRITDAGRLALSSASTGKENTDE